MYIYICTHTNTHTHTHAHLHPETNGRRARARPHAQHIVRLAQQRSETRARHLDRWQFFQFCQHSFRNLVVRAVVWVVGLWDGSGRRGRDGSLPDDVAPVLCVWVYECLYTHIHIFLYIYLRMCVYIYIYVCTYVYKYVLHIVLLTT